MPTEPETSVGRYPFLLLVVGRAPALIADHFDLTNGGALLHDGRVADGT